MANQNERAVIDLVINGKQSETTLKEVATAAVNARKELNKMRESDNPQAYAAKVAQVKALNQAMADHNEKLRATRKATDDWGLSWKSIAQGVLGGNALTAGFNMLLSVGPKVLDQGMKIKDSFADIGKATGLSDGEVKKLNESLKQINTRTATEELRNIAVVGGQLGVTNDQLLGFVENADKAVVALGDEFSGGVEEVSKSIGGMAKLFKETKDMDIGPAINNIGSALNELGAAGSATAPVVAEFTTRMGQLGDLSPQISETMGLGAALQELGLSAEIGAGGLSNILLTAAKDTATFAKQLGLSEQAMKELINTNPNEFLLKLAESLKNLPADQQAKALDALGIKSQEATKVMSLLANQTDMVRQKQELASKAMAEGTSLTNEFNKKNFDLAVNLKRIREWVDNLLQGDGIQGLAAAFVEATTRVLGLTTASEAATKEFNRQKSEVENLEKTLPGLAKRHDELKSKSKLNKEEQEELKKVVAQIAETVPSAVTEWDEYGRALGVNTQKAREFIKTQRALLEYQNRDAIEESESELERLERRQKTLQAKLKSGKESYTTTGGIVESTMTNEQIAGYVKDLTKVSAEADNVRARLKGLKGEMLETAAAPAPGAGKPTPGQPKTGTSTLETKEQESARKSKIKAAEKAEDDLEKMLATARAKHEESLHNEFGKEQLLFGQKYSKMYELAKGNKDQMAQITELMYKELADIEAREAERQKVKREAEMKAKVKASEEALELVMENKKSELALDVAGKKVTAEDAKTRELELEQTYLEAKRLLYEGYYQQLEALGFTDKEKQTAIAEEKKANLAKIDQDIAQSTTDQTLSRMDAAESYKQKTLEVNTYVKEAEFDLVAAKREAAAQGLAILSSFFKESSGIQKALFVAEKAFAIGGIIVSLQKQLAAISLAAAEQAAQASAIPIVGPALAAAAKAAGIKNALAAKVQAGMSIATIAGQTIQGVAMKAAGGFTDVETMYGNPSGFVDGPTLFAQGKRSFVAGEAGREFVISNPALRTPAIANIAGILDTVQKTGNFGAAGSMMAGAMGGPSTEMLGAILAELQANRRELQQVRQVTQEAGARPVAFNFHQFEDTQAFLAQIREETTY
ncbi:phage tail tape measure protein [Larkinella insperata]|uniref:Phage tail tape measure protein n=1 Tax=Larkinella insperata TaxID=332158 RepID=A0ABW3Q8R2_9BACT|nr:phage tail tape measure protein [Larkinella insperata]